MVHEFASRERAFGKTVVVVVVAAAAAADGYGDAAVADDDGVEDVCLVWDIVAGTYWSHHSRLIAIAHATRAV